MPRRALAVPFAALALLAAACGGGSSDAGRVEPTEWATDVCTAMGAWVDSVETRAAELDQAASASSSLDDVKAEFVQFFAASLEDVDVMLDAVEAAGAPSGDQGEEVRDALRSNLEPIRQILADARDSAEELSTDDPLQFASEAQELGTSVQSELGEVGTAFDDLSGEYEDVFEGDEPEACRELESRG